jgi:hypothetical protein
MSVWQCAPSASVLCGSEGELVSVSISVEPRDLEALLESLATLDFPINPQIYHGSRTAVEFPAYRGRLEQVQTAVAGVNSADICVKGMLEEIHACS